MPLFARILKSEINITDLRKKAGKNYLIKLDKNSVLDSFRYFLKKENFDGRDGELLYNELERLLDYYELEE